jgi:two-component system sensor histidine kinase BaeS
MRFGITSRLFTAILVTNVVMATAFGVAMHISVNRGFRDYVVEREERRLATLAQLLGSAYAEHGNSWDFLRNDDALWRAFVRERPDRGPPERPGTARGAGVPAPPEAPSAPAREGVPLDAGAPPMLPPHPDPGAGPPRVRTTSAASLLLLDATRKRVAGSPAGESESALTEPVVVNGATVGFLSLPQPELAGADTRFLAQLLGTGWIVAGFALLVAAAAAIPLARGLIAPIRRLAQATHRLAVGDYTPMLAVTSADELGQLTQDFNRLAATLKDIEAMRRAFLADVSHELRTPIAVLRAELEALQDGVRSTTPDAIRSLSAEVATLSRLVDDLYDLAVADLGPGSYRHEEVDLAQITRDALGAFAERFAARRLDVDASGITSGPAIVHGDPRRLTQVLNNLLENTVRYTDAGGRVRVGVRVEGRDVALDIMDSAPGVPEQLLPRLFERLFRVETSRSREFGGAGLGLALCESIVRAHGGTIRAKASPLGGVWIALRLPHAGASYPEPS